MKDTRFMCETSMETHSILLTGGAGFIGTNLVNELRKRGHDVFAADQYNTAQEGSYLRTDVRNYRQVQKLFSEREFEYVYHLAAEYGRWNGEDYYENLWTTNVVGTKHVLRMQEKKGFRLIFFSSAEVYGDYAGVMTEDVMERQPIKDTYQMNDYAITKWAGELMCMNSATMFGTETVRVRPVNCYGPYEHYTPYRGFIPTFIYHALFDQPYEVHEGHRRIIDYVDDSCRTFANICDAFIPGEVYNVGGRPEWEPTSVSTRTWFLTPLAWTILVSPTSERNPLRRRENGSTVQRRSTI